MGFYVLFELLLYSKISKDLLPLEIVFPLSNKLSCALHIEHLFFSCSIILHVSEYIVALEFSRKSYAYCLVDAVVMIMTAFISTIANITIIYTLSLVLMDMQKKIFHIITNVHLSQSNSRMDGINGCVGCRERAKKNPEIINCLSDCKQQFFYTLYAFVCNAIIKREIEMKR